MDKLRNRVNKEFEDYKSELLIHTKEYILEKSYETIIKEELVFLIEDVELSADLLKQLCDCKNCLDFLYSEYLEHDGADIRDGLELVFQSLERDYRGGCDILKPIYNVYVHDFNEGKIKEYNIFNHGRFYEDVKKSLKKCKTKEEFASEFKKDLQYYFWSKCEWEIVLTSFPARVSKEGLNMMNAEFGEKTEQYGHEPYCIGVNLDIEEKIDVYQQCMLNFFILVDYVWSMKG